MRSLLIMIPKELSPEAESIRLQIKDMIPELKRGSLAAILEGEGPNISYEGEPMKEQLVKLLKHLPIPDPEVRALTFFS